MVNSIHLYAPACTVQFANRHYTPHEDLMKRLHLHVLSDRNERDDNVAAIYRKSLLYFVSNALETDLRTPILGLANAGVKDVGVRQYTAPDRAPIATRAALPPRGVTYATTTGSARRCSTRESPATTATAPSRGIRLYGRSERDPTTTSEALSAVTATTSAAWSPSTSGPAWK